MKKYILVEIDLAEGIEPEFATSEDVGRLIRYGYQAEEGLPAAGVRVADVTEIVEDSDPRGPWLATNGWGESEPFYPDWSS